MATSPPAAPGADPTRGPTLAGSRRLLDAAAGPLHPVARDTLAAAVEVGWADPARLHAEGRRARALLDRAREVVAAGLGVRPPEVSFPPSGPTALARAVDGVLYAAGRRGARTVASAVEHSAILVPGRARAARSHDPALFAEVGVTPTGAVDLDAWRRAVSTDGTVRCTPALERTVESILRATTRGR